MNTCEIEIKNKTYTLCLNRASVKLMESKGFDIQEFAKKPITYMEMLWAGGFIKNHSDLSYDEIVDLMDAYIEEGGDITEVVTFLSQEYASFVSAPTDTKSKKTAKITKR